MKGYGDLQRKQTKNVDPLVLELFRGVRQVVDILERLTIERMAAQPEAAAVARTSEAKGLERPALPRNPSLSYSIKDVSKQTGLSRSRIYLAISTGELRATKCGHRTLIQAKDLNAWIDSWPAVVPSPPG